MPGLTAAAPFLVAQANPPAGAGNQGLGPYTIVLYVGAALLWLYLFLILPEQKQKKQRKAMIDALKKNDRVLTAAGIYGTVVSVDDTQDRVVVRVDDDRGVKVAFTRASIVRIFDGSTEKEKEKAAAGS